MLIWQLGSLDDKLEMWINSISAESVILTNIATDTLMCPWQNTYDIESLSFTLYAVNRHFIHQPQWQGEKSDFDSNFSI